MTSPSVCLRVLVRLVYHDETCKQLNPMEEGEEVADRRGGGWQSPRRVFLCPTTLGECASVLGGIGSTSVHVRQNNAGVSF